MAVVASNSVFLTVRESPSQPQRGWVIKVRHPLDMSTLLAEFNEWVTFSIGPQLNDVGAGSITLDLDTAFWHHLLPNGYTGFYLLQFECLWEAWENGVLRFQWLGQVVEENFIEEAGTRTVTVSGPGIAEVLKWGISLRPGYPKAPQGSQEDTTGYSGTDGKPGFYWGFLQKWPAMQMWYTVFQAAQKRGCFPWVQLMFTPTRDSTGKAWEYVPIVLNEAGDAYQWHPEETLKDSLDRCTGQDPTVNFAEWNEWFMWPGFKLDVRKTIGSHREKYVIFYEGQTVTKSRTRTREDVHNFIVVRDVAGAESTAANPASIATWNRREKWENNNQNVTDVARRNAIANIFIAQQKDEKSEWTIKVPADLPGRTPFTDFNIGDWIGIGNYVRSGGGDPATDIGADHFGVNAVDAYRVMAITVEVDSNGYPTVELTLESIIEDYQRRLQQQFTRIINNVNEVADDPLKNAKDNRTDKSQPGLLVKNPDGTYSIEDSTSLNTGSGGYGNGVRVFIQDTDPGDAANDGDFWYAPNGGTTISPVPVYDPTEDLKKVEKVYPGHDGLQYKPGLDRPEHKDW